MNDGKMEGKNEERNLQSTFFGGTRLTCLSPKVEHQERSQLLGSE